jgi:simple sugar transport system permease protein
MNVEIESRETLSPWIAYLTPVFTVVAALVVSATMLLVLDIDPIAAYSQMFVDTPLDRRGQDEILVESAPLIFTGLAVYLPLKAGLWNIGAEGQLVVGAILGTWIGLNVSLPYYVLLPAMFLGAALAGAIWAGVPAYLRARWDINEIITTLLLTEVALLVNQYVVRNRMASTLTTRKSENLPDAAVLPDIAIPGVLARDVHVGILLALVIGLLAYLLMTRTRLGYEITFVGSNHEAAEQAGMSKRKVYLFVFVVGGALAGFAGASDIAGVQETLRAEYEPGFGFTAIIIALLGRNSAIKVVAAAVFFALLRVGGERMSVGFGIDPAVVEVIQALIILFLITAEFFKRYDVSIDFGDDRSTGATPAGGDD